MGKKDELREQASRYWQFTANGARRAEHGIFEEGFDVGYASRDEEIERLRAPWIPVTERLPEKTDAYWVTRLVDGGKSATICQRGFIADDPESEQRWRRHYTAWMPIYRLEPYQAALKEGEDG